MKTKFNKVKIEHLLASVLKPTRYIAQEINSYNKIPSDETINFCLAFPDVYEVGFSHLGLKILYSILNKENNAVADRVYAPWTDFAKILQKEKIPLYGLESFFPLTDFVVIGFTLQSELTFTNILYMLDLAKIPLFSKDRDDNFPIILGGGPCVSNPESMADFFDAFLIGDGEEAIIEIKNALLLTKNSSKNEKLLKLSEINGVYIPAFYETKAGFMQPKIPNIPPKIRIRKFMDFDDVEKQHKNQLVPWMQATHNRYVSEIMRGCSRGCRFCHAGMFYRPVRERDPDKIIGLVNEGLQNDGWHEVALTSLSSSDYSCIKYTLYELYKNLESTRTSISLPSLRVDSLDDEIVKLLNAMHQTGMTIAPEAGSQRLRDIINKNITEEDILKGVEIALKNGWRQMKLYFMIGLPFEEQSDIQAIVDLMEKIVGISRKQIQINITVSPFVPKSFTPFQWAAMENTEILLEKIYFIKNSLAKYKFIKVKHHSIEKLILECVLGRGDRSVSEWIYQAYKNGAIYDGWMEFFDFSIWEKSARDIDFDFIKFLQKKSFEETLPWDHIDIMINKDFLLDEWNKAKQIQTTVDCKTDYCTNCGACNIEIKPIYKKSPEIVLPEIKKIEIINHQVSFYYRIFYAKTGLMRFVAHLDLLRMLQRSLRKSKLAISYSQGYTPRPIFALGPPLSLGVEGENEYVDISLREKVKTELVLEEFKKILPQNLVLNDVIILPTKDLRSMDYYLFEEIHVYPKADMEKSFIKNIELYLSKDTWKIERVRKKKVKISDLKDIIQKMSWDNDHFIVVKKRTGASIYDILNFVFRIEREQTNDLRIVRKRFLRLQ
ncbi:MAG: TIGR03960 family B12-binding radical SAM protein [Candidatus Cloacimonetes bacterium]|nr:TIGR03960 family B12-binding radical SAM protein [Candidatus Cloacimonadota bacterium]